MRRHAEILFDLTAHAIVKQRVLEGQDQDEDWALGHALIFPCIWRLGSPDRDSFQFRVARDDKHMARLGECDVVDAFTPEDDVLAASYELRDEAGWFRLWEVDGQDITAWVTQVPIADRREEHLGSADSGIRLYRRLLREQLDRLAGRGRDPLRIVRERGATKIIEFQRRSVSRRVHAAAQHDRRFEPPDCG